MSDAKSAFKNALLRYREQNKLFITFKSNDGGEHISSYSKEKINGAIIILKIDLDNEKHAEFLISQNEHEEIFGQKLG